VCYRTRLLRIEPADGHFRLHLDINGAVRVETARKVIIATGFEGSGGVYVPPALSAGLPARLYAHTQDPIDFPALRGKRVAVVGGAASAFDAAGVALEAGAASVDLFARRAALASVPVARVRGYPGAYDNYPELPDAVRWHQAIRFRRAGSTPPADAIERVLKFSNFTLARGARGGRPCRRTGGGWGIPLRFRDRRHRLFCRSRRAARARRFCLRHFTVARPFHAASRRAGRISRRPSLSRHCSRISGKDPRRGTLSEGHPRPEPGRLC
jgi:hypothetical protein